MIPSFIKKSKIFSLLILIALFAACNNNRGTDPEFNYDKIVTRDTVKNNSLIPATANDTQTIAIPTAVKQTANTAANGINPPHGQPGHRCDIVEGAPLNSKPTSNKPQQTPAQQTPPQIVTTTKTKTPAGMNPPHGEPGHRCDIAVGAPLNSKPVNTATQKQTTATTKTVTAPGMNPPHGEPGHRCDIPVGTPLSQPVKTTADTNKVLPTVKDSSKK
jgi:hypothetical protein